MARIHDITKIPIVALVALKPYMELTDKNFGRIENEEYYLYFKGLKTTESCFFWSSNARSQKQYSCIFNYNATNINN